LNREKRKRQQELEVEEKKHQKKLRQDIDNIRQIIEEIDEKEDILEEHRMVKDIQHKEHENDPKKLGKYAFEEPIKPILLPEELPQHLRELKSVVDVAKDRFMSFQRRNMIEVSKQTSSSRNSRGPQKKKFKSKKVMERPNLDIWEYN